MKLFVTGAGGFVGRAVVDEARSRGHDVVAMVRSTKAVVETPGATMVVGDLRQDGPWVAALATCDAVVHLAASTGDFYDQLASTVLGTERLLAAMSDNGVKRLVHISTFSLYDYRAIPAKGWLDETSPLELRPEDRDDYTQTKLLQEQLVRNFGSSVGEVVIIRPGAIYGPGKLWDAGLTVRLFGSTWAAIAPNGRQKLTYVGNCARAIVLAAEVDGAIGQIMNIVDDDLPTQREYAAAMARHGFDVPRRAADSVSPRGRRCRRDRQGQPAILQRQGAVAGVHRPGEARRAVQTVPVLQRSSEAGARMATIDNPGRGPRCDRLVRAGAGTR